MFETAFEAACVGLPSASSLAQHVEPSPWADVSSRNQNCMITTQGLCNNVSKKNLNHTKNDILCAPIKLKRLKLFIFLKMYNHLCPFRDVFV